MPNPDSGTPDAGKSTTELYSDLAQRLNTSLKPHFGGKVTFVSASRRSVALTEQFPEPMTIGYVAYDCQILPGGVLSMPMPTLQRLSGSPMAAAAVWNSAGLVTAWYTADEAPRRQRITEWMQQNLAKEQPAVNAVEFLSLPKWDMDRRRMIRDLGMIPR